MKILLLEDDEALALGIEFTLKGEGYQVIRCSLVSEAIKIFQEDKFDLAILDINLPDGSGYDVCRFMRERSNIPIIFLTALDDEVNVVLGLEIGGDDYITKPFRVRELVSRIKVIFRRLNNDNVELNYLRSGDIELNKKTATVKVRGKEVLFTAQEYKLLLIFMNNHGRVLERDVILDKLLEGNGSFVDSNTLSVYIKRIREKIEENPKELRYISTVRGIGYKWGEVVSKE
ncbi:response regulator transcription factor [Clostridium sp.]|uniref:response regulator transcription factor n=1 Tax=Clostridium sp. TaxID=1506 RepID=UPI003463DA80